MRVLTANEAAILTYLEDVSRGAPRILFLSGTPMCEAMIDTRKLGYSQAVGYDEPGHAERNVITSSGERALRIHREYLKGK